MKDLRTLDLNLLKAFNLLMQEKNVSQAAQRMSITQPAMSGILLRLRNSFDDPLFVRTPYGVVPTNKALEIAPKIDNILNEIETLLKTSNFDPKTVDITLKIACTDYVMQVVIVPFLHLLKKQAPKIKLAILSIDDDLIQTQLEQKRIDFAFVTSAFKAPDIHAKKLYFEKYICAVGEKHPIAKQKLLSIEQFCQTEQMIVSYRGGDFYGVTDMALSKLDLKRNVTVSIQNFTLLSVLLEQNNLLAVVPYRLVSHLKNIKLFQPPLEIEGFTKTLIWHERTHRDPIYQWLRKLIMKACETSDK